MLVLSRKNIERIFIGDTIVVTVVKVQGGVVRLGIEAPPGDLDHSRRAAEAATTHAAEARPDAAPGGATLRGEIFKASLPAMAAQSESSSGTFQ